MATLRTAFVQTYQSGNSCFSLLTGLPSILQSLTNYDEKSSKEGLGSLATKGIKMTSSF